VYPNFAGKCLPFVILFKRMSKLNNLFLLRALFLRAAWKHIVVILLTNKQDIFFKACN
jgi:hypothetical protein